MKKERMTIEELRTLNLPITLECDDGVYVKDLKAITVIAVGNEKAFIKSNNGYEQNFLIEQLVHYPSLKESPKYETLYECIDNQGGLKLLNRSHLPLKPRNMAD